MVIDRLCSLFIAAVCLYLLHYVLLITTYASFNVPTDSMLPTLQNGDYLLVNKWYMGGRIFNLQDIAKGKQGKTWRLPGYSKLKRNDIMVFNFPYPSSAYPDSIYMDFSLYYVKRCIALPGDTVEIHNGKYAIRGLDESVGYLPAQKRMAHRRGDMHLLRTKVYPGDSILGWTLFDFGPLLIPAQGQMVSMDSTNYKLYRNLISWEQKAPLNRRRNEILLGDSVITRYEFQSNYYFAGGDNVTSSRDSRYWGLVPEDFIVGKAWVIWKSVNPRNGRFRWDRVLKRL